MLIESVCVECNDKQSKGERQRALHEQERRVCLSMDFGLLYLCACFHATQTSTYEEGEAMATRLLHLCVYHHV